MAQTRKTRYTTRRGLHAVRYRSRWIKVQLLEDQVNTGRWFAPATDEGLEYVLSGGDNSCYRSIRKMIEEEGIVGRRGAACELLGRDAYEIEEEVL